jgi:hypothetical protein
MCGKCPILSHIGNPQSIIDKTKHEKLILPPLVQNLGVWGTATIDCGIEFKNQRHDEAAGDESYVKWLMSHTNAKSSPAQKGLLHHQASPGSTGMSGEDSDGILRILCLVLQSHDAWQRPVSKLNLLCEDTVPGVFCGPVCRVDCLLSTTWVPFRFCVGRFCRLPAQHIKRSL